jgi:hypothetical protein
MKVIRAVIVVALIPVVLGLVSADARDEGACEQTLIPPVKTPFSVNGSALRELLPLCQKDSDHVDGSWEIPRRHTCGGRVSFKKEFVCCDSNENAPAIEGYCPEMKDFGLKGIWSGCVSTT